ncbi:hypothetical protein ACIA8K_07170 [Catenuloplanes sp. NPDC051500]|uniref:hypothetical protein n=1 Tax=Catenuloplanes sp. NPDC051500 TaxID=3363959 RepID=UPI0037A891AF
MDIETTLDALAAAWRFAGAHEDAVTIAVGAGLVLVALIAMKRADKRTGRPDRVLRRWLKIAILIWSAEGMWEVATQDLNFGRALALIVFAAGDVWIICEMIAAERAPQGSVEQRKHVVWVWRIAAVLGTIVSFSADSLVEIPLRFVLPLGAVLIWKLGLPNAGDGDAARDENALTWMVIPWLRQQVIAIGLAKPGKVDREAVDRDQMVARITRVRFALWKAQADGRGRRVVRLTARLHRLSLAADDEMLAAAGERVQRALVAEARTRPLTAEQVDQLAATERAAAEAVAAAERAAADAAAAAEEAERQRQEAIADADRQRQRAEEAAAAVRAVGSDRQQADAAAADALAAIQRQAAAELADLRRRLERQTAESERQQQTAAAGAGALQRQIADLRQRAEDERAERQRTAADAAQRAERQAEQWRAEIAAARGDTAAARAHADQLAAELAEARARQPRPAGSSAETAAQVAAYREEHPTATQAEVAAAIGMSVRTVRTYWTQQLTTTGAHR